MSDEMDYSDVHEAALASTKLDPKEIRAQLPIGYVLHKYGIELTEEDGQLKAPCPFHEDNKPSFDVFGENLESWGCYPCFGGLGGDVVDLIGKLDNQEHRFAIARSMIEELKREGWDGPRKGKPRKKLDLVKAAGFVERSYARANIELLDAFCKLKGYKFDGKYLYEEFGVGTWSDWIVIPFYGPDGSLGAFKKRTMSEKPRAAGGSNFDNLFYNHWRLTDDAERPIILCEGESDTQATHHALGASCVVLGIPTGAGDEKGAREPVQARLLAGRTVILAFDGDDSGRAARTAWSNALTKLGCVVKIAILPEGLDMASPEVDPKAIIEAASQTHLKVPTEIRAEPSGYTRPGKTANAENQDLSNWYYKPTRELVGESGTLAYEGFIEPGHRETVIGSFDMKNRSRLNDWSQRHGRSWIGSDRDAGLVSMLLQSEGPMLAKGRLATVAGYQDGHFVWPGGEIGPDYWKYVRPSSDVHLENKIKVEEKEWTPEYVNLLRSLHTQEIMDPLLAWLAVAPLRSLLREFPPLSITGSSGTGKTTLTETVIPALSGSLIANNLTNTTKHALFAYLGSTNSFPVWFDEFRPGSRRDSIVALKQYLRDVYTGQSSSTGGMNRDNWAEVTQIPMLAPMIVSGEDAFSEQSHTERMILISLPQQGKNEDALREVRKHGDTGLPHAYLSWLQRGLAAGTLPDIKNVSRGDAKLPPRQRLSLGVLHLGWELLTQFMEEHGSSLSAPNFDHPTREGLAAMNRVPIEEALHWATGEDGANEFIFKANIERLGPCWCVRVVNFVHFVKKVDEFDLPGGATAVARHLADKYEAEEVSIIHYGVSKKVLAIKESALNWN